MINRSMQPRQMYGLGSLVKKAVKGVKNVIKSPIGKAAMLGAVGFGIPGTKLGGLFGRAAFGGQATGLLGSAGIGQFLMGTPGVADTVGRTGFLDKIGFTGLSTAAKTFLGGSAALSIAAMFPQQEGEDDDTYAERLKRLEPLMNRYYSNVNPNASAAEVKKFIQDNTQEYRAMGGRVGYRLGGDTMDREGIKSLEAGAPDVRYTGNMKMASETGPEEFEMDMLMELTQAFEEAKKQGFRGDFKSFLDMYLGDSARKPQGIMQEAPMQMAANGGRIGLELGGALGRLMQGRKGEETDMSNVFTVGDGIKIFIKDDKDQPEITGRGFQGDGQGGMEEIFVLDDGSRITVMDYFEKYGAPKNYKKGGRVGFRDGSSTGSFGLDRYASEMLSEGKMLDKDATDFLNKYEDIVKEGKADERLFDLLKEYRTLEDKADKSLDKFSNTKLEDAAEGIMSVEDMKYYDKKMKDIDKKLMDKDERLSDIDTEFATKGIDASEITRTPDFQEWLKLYMSEKGSSRMKSLNHPNADIYLGILGVRLKGRDKSFYETVQIPTGKMRMNEGGVMERDYRDEGGFVPVGIKEKADDVPAMLSKNEFVMTADAVRGAGGGSIEKGAQRMYDTMKSLERKVG